MQPRTQEEADRNLVRASILAAKAGRPLSPDSPAGRAVKAATARMGADAVKKVTMEEGLELERQVSVAAARGAAQPPGWRPVPANSATERNRESLAGLGAVDISGGASTIENDQKNGRFLDRFIAAERARAIMAQPEYAEAMQRVQAQARRESRQPTAQDLQEQLEAVRRERGPQPATPPAPVVKLLADPVAKESMSSRSPSPTVDRIGGR
jgi:DNA segregation ATPase FtsK/SpoIIIE-like protein